MIIDTMVMAYAVLGVPDFGRESAAAFIAAARYRRTLLLTYDQKLLKLFPDDTVTVKEVLT
jgi:hypothetical protein